MALRNVFRIFKNTNKLLYKSYSSFSKPSNNICNCKYQFRTFTDDTIESKDHLEEIDDHIDQIKIRNLLYENSTDNLILQLNDCASVQNVFNIIRENHGKMDDSHISQAVLVLWDLQKIFYRHNIYYEDNNTNSLLTTNAILQNYMNQVNSHQDFETLIKLIEENYEKFSLDALTCTLLYLNRMGVKLKTNVMSNMINRCQNEIKNCDIDNFPLTSLSRFIVTVFNQDYFYPLSADSMKIILRRLDTCRTEEDFKLLTICLYKMNQILNMETLKKYKQLANNLLDGNVINKTHPRTIIKTIRFLNQPQWFEYNLNCTNKFIHLLKGSIHVLTAAELVSLFKVFQVQKEPADMLQEIQEHATKLLQFEDNFLTTIDLISCVVLFSSPLQRPKFDTLLREYMKNNFTIDSINSLYKILYYVRSPDLKLCNYFWDKSLNLILNDNLNKLQNMLNLSNKYIHFTNNIGFKYRYFNFEKKVIDYFNNELNNNNFSPEKFVKISSFIISYNQDLNYTEKILERLINMSNKFDINNKLTISKGIQCLNDNIRNNNLTKRIELLNNELNNCINKEINNETTLPDINLHLKSFIIRKQSIEDDLFKKLLIIFNETSNQLTSHIVRDFCYYLQINNCLIPNVINKLVQYIITKKENILGNTVDKVLNLCYSLGYTPEESELFLETSSEIIIRDKDRFSGLSFLQSCLSLSYFHALPDILIKRIFSVGFLEKLDEELSNCYAKTTYPTRVRDLLMQLNRSVCIDYPQFDIPWFHQKYIDENQKKRHGQQDFFHKEVYGILKDIVDNVVENSYTPYGYHIDFEINNNKTAILLLNSYAFSTKTVNLKGYHQLKNRHLEILGYNLICINYSEWKSFYTPEKCKEYVQNKINPLNKISQI